MRGDDFIQGAMFSYVDLNGRVPAAHPLRPLKQVVDAILISMSAEFDARYAVLGRPSIPPERLLRALLLQVAVHHPQRTAAGRAAGLQPAVSLVRRPGH